MSEYGLLNRFRLYSSNSLAVCCVIPSEYHIEVDKELKNIYERSME